MNASEYRKERDEALQQLQELKASLEIEKTETLRLGVANSLLETQVFELTNANGELQRDMLGTAEGLHAAHGKIAELETQLQVARAEAERLAAQRAAANAPRRRETETVAVELNGEELSIGDAFKARVANAVKRGSSIAILRPDGSAALTILGNKVPKGAVAHLEQLLVKSPDTV